MFPLGRMKGTGGICDLRSRMKFVPNPSSTAVGNGKWFLYHPDKG